MNKEDKQIEKEIRWQKRAGMGYGEIARLLGMDRNTIRYHYDPKLKEYHKRYYRNNKSMNEKYTYEEIKSTKEALQAFVDAGVLIKFVKNGEWVYQDNPEFKKKSKTEQGKILNNL